MAARSDADTAVAHAEPVRRLDRGPALAAPGATAAFVAIEMPAPPKAAARAAADAAASSSIDDPLIQIELRRGPLHLNVRWPIAAAGDCRAWLSELSSGLLK